MSKVQIKLNSAGVRQLLRSEEMKAICSQLASDARFRCGAGYETDARTGKNRVNAMLWADTPAARRDNMKNNTILKALK